MTRPGLGNSEQQPWTQPRWGVGVWLLHWALAERRALQWGRVEK